MLKIYVDASTKGNPGPSGIGIQLIDDNHYLQLNYPLSDMSNHQAEFVAMEAGLTEAIDRGLNSQTTFVYSDSKVVCETIDKNFTQNDTFKPYLKRIQQLIPEFDLIIIQWIPEKQNKGADNLARQGLQKALQKIEKEA